MTVIDRFLKLVSYPTTSDERSETCPSTPRQLALAEELVRQMQEMGIADAHVDADGYVYGTIPANCEKDIPVYGLIAHMDTAPDRFLQCFLRSARQTVPRQRRPVQIQRNHTDRIKIKVTAVNRTRADGCGSRLIISFHIPPHFSRQSKNS